MKIYTKRGDFGETGIVGGSRVDKDSTLMEAIGTVDELNATLGACLCIAEDEALREPLEWVQNWLFDLGAELATPPGSQQNATIEERNILYLEESIDLLNDTLAPLKNFILPGGSQLAVSLHLSRAVCRRTERAVLALHREQPLRGEILAFLNRLSDWLFVAARAANTATGIDDVLWTKSEWN